MIFYFTGLSVAAVGKTAGEVVNEVRRQFKEDPGIMQGTSAPNYRVCIGLVTKAALKEMRWPGLLAVSSPVAIGLIFRIIGSYTSRPYLGAHALGGIREFTLLSPAYYHNLFPHTLIFVIGFLRFSTVAGILMALFLDNVGGITSLSPPKTFFLKIIVCAFRSMG